MKRYNIELCGIGYVQAYAREEGEHCSAEEAIAEIAKRDAEIEAFHARIAELEAERDRLTKRVQTISASVEHHVAAAIASESSKWSTALRALVEDIGTGMTVAALLSRSNCPECEEYPDELVTLCPYHKAKALLDGEQ